MSCVHFGGGYTGVSTDQKSVDQKKDLGEEIFFSMRARKLLYLRYLMAIKAFHRTGLARESRGSSLMKSCNTKG